MLQILSHLIFFVLSHKGYSMYKMCILSLYKFLYSINKPILFACEDTCNRMCAYIQYYMFGCTSINVKVYQISILVYKITVCPVPCEKIPIRRNCIFLMRTHVQIIIRLTFPLSLILDKENGGKWWGKRHGRIKFAQRLQKIFYLCVLKFVYISCFFFSMQFRFLAIMNFFFSVKKT